MDGMVGQMAAYWDEMIVVMRVGFRADKMVEKMAMKRAGYMAMH